MYGERMHTTCPVIEESPTTMRRLRITVLRGGPSAEREISLASGQAVADVLRRRGHDVFVSDIGPDNLAALEQPADVVFPALHGTFGEDGVLQVILERRGIRFVGSGSRACALAMDKVAAKQRVAELGIDTPAFEVVTNESLARGAPRLAPPVVVKPVAEGSSVLTTIVREADALLPAVRAVVERYGRALLERFIAGDEITVWRSIRFPVSRAIRWCRKRPPAWACRSMSWSSNWCVWPRRKARESLQGKQTPGAVGPQA